MSIPSKKRSKKRRRTQCSPPGKLPKMTGQVRGGMAHFGDKPYSPWHTMVCIMVGYTLHYIRVHRATVLHYIYKQPIYKLCMEASQQRGTVKKTSWFE